MKEQNVYQRLLEAQHELKAPRSIKGRFGNGRSAEQILEDAKPVCYKHGLYLYTSDTVERVGERNYITATATVVNVDNPEESHSADASAWEGDVVNSLDTSQVSGKTSSYAKKYALQNLFAIDDTKDADQDEAPKMKPTETVYSEPSTIGTGKAVKSSEVIAGEFDEPFPSKPSETQLLEARELLENTGYSTELIDGRLKLIKTSQELNEFMAKLKEQA